MRRFCATVCKTVRPMLWDCCLSVCLVTLVYYGQTVGRIKMPLSTEVVISPGNIVLDGDPALPIERSTAAPPPLFDPLCSGSGTVAHLSNCCALVVKLV